LAAPCPRELGGRAGKPPLSFPFRQLFNRLRCSRPVGLLRYYLYRYALSFPRRVACDICGWRGRRFLDFEDRRVMCPRCGSLVRHRLFAAALRSFPACRPEALFVGKRVLHFSPEYCVGLLLRPAAGQYTKADFIGTDRDVRADITNMPEIATGSCDFLFAFDVLEHVASDALALTEIYRVLAPDGVAALSAPQQFALDFTVEDPTVITDDDRRRAYGQSDHRRLYGADLADRLRAAGFHLFVVDYNSFPPAETARHVYFSPICDDRPFHFNHRRVFFCFKKRPS